MLTRAGVGLGAAGAAAAGLTQISQLSVHVFGREIRATWIEGLSIAAVMVGVLAYEQLKSRPRA